jgi:hypothetical protein
MTRLERRYRRLLRALPRWYRGEREEEMVATYLATRHHADPEDEALDLEYGWPGWREAWATAALSVRVRLAASAAPPRVLVLGRAVRLAALLGLLVQSALAAAGLVDMIVTALLHPHEGVVTPATVGDMALLLLPAVTVVLLVRGHRAWARITAAAALVPAVFGSADLWPFVAVELPLWVAVICLYAGFHHDAPTPPAVPWLRAQAAAIGLGVLWIAVAKLAGSDPWTWVTIDNAAAVVNWAIVVAGLAVVLMAPRRDPSFRAWAGGVAICAASCLPLEAASAWFAGQLYAQGSIGTLPLLWAWAQVGILAVVTVATAAVGLLVPRAFGRYVRQARHLR